MELKLIQEEAADCRAAWQGRSVGSIARHCHHDALLEVLMEMPGERITHILTRKPPEERALRLHLFRPMKLKRGEVPQKKKKYDAARRKCDAAEKKYAVAWRKYYVEQKGYYVSCNAAKYDAAWRKYVVAGEKYDVAQKEYHVAQEKFLTSAALVEQHAKECPGCPWDGKTIFREGRLR